GGAGRRAGPPQARPDPLGGSTAYCSGQGLSSSTQVDECLQDLVLRLDRLRVRLVDALRGDHVDELAGEVAVRLLERAGLQRAEVGAARRAHRRVAGGIAARPHVAAERVQALRVAKARELELAGGLGLA